MIAKIILISSRHAIDQIFDYIVPISMEKSICPGMRVIVPFGIYNMPVEGLVISLCEKSDRMSLKRIRCKAEFSEVLDESLIDLCFWMQRQYLCSFHSAFRLVAPPRLKAVIREWITLNESSAALTEFQLRVTEAVRDNGGIIEYNHLAETIGSSGLRRAITALKEKGVISLSEKLSDSVRELTVRRAKLAVPIEEAYMAADFLKSNRAATQANMLLTLADSGIMSTSELISVSNGNSSSLRALADKGYIELYNERKFRSVYNPDSFGREAEYTPTDEQRPIIQYIDKLLENGKHEEILIRGVTGSGKTEVFLQTIRRCIELGKRAVMLVPEISLTPQMVERFVSRFGNRVAVVHSGLSSGERFDQWSKILNNEVDVVVGARSAVFAPLSNIGIIIIDEEHEGSYKSEISPRYHARDVAKHRAELSGAPLILASATPSVESYYRALDTDECRLFEMNRRYNNNSLPEVRIVDMRSELFDYHNMSPISGRLEFEIRKNLERGEKTILFLNRRGYNTFVSCRKCGYVAECSNCSVPLTYHRNNDSLVCHYCGYTSGSLTTCPECGSRHVKFFGTGTQKIEEALKDMFPGAAILRMDRDTTERKGSHEQLLRSFKESGDILLGTQMVTKGLDISDVSLVGVLAADSSLGADDFRANERTFSLLTQVCGRAGRGDIPGRAVIQTYQPRNSTIEFAKNHNYTDFYKNEIKFRKRLNYPPFCDIICILVSGPDEEKIRYELGRIHAYIAARGDKENIIKLTEPMPAPIQRINKSYRHRILVKVKSSDGFLDMLHRINDAHIKKSFGNTLIIDINPVNMS